MIAARLPDHDQQALRLSIKLVALLVDGAVVAATEQGEIRERASPHVDHDLNPSSSASFSGRLAGAAEGR